MPSSRPNSAALTAPGAVSGSALGSATPSNCPAMQAEEPSVQEKEIISAIACYKRFKNSQYASVVSMSLKKGADDNEQKRRAAETARATIAMTTSPIKGQVKAALKANGKGKGQVNPVRAKVTSKENATICTPFFGSSTVFTRRLRNDVVDPSLLISRTDKSSLHTINTIIFNSSAGKKGNKNEASHHQHHHNHSQQTSRVSVSLRPTPHLTPLPSASPLPLSTHTSFLPFPNLSVPDAPTLTYVPWFGDDDKEDVVSDVYDTRERELVLKGGEGWRREGKDEEVAMVLAELVKSGTLTLTVVAAAGNGDAYAELLEDVARQCKVETKVVLEQYRKMSETSMSSSELELEQPKKKKQKKKNRDQQQVQQEQEEKSYSQLMDSYTNLFCRACFTYDCNIHGATRKPPLEQLEDEGVQREVEKMRTANDRVATDKATIEATSEANGETIPAVNSISDVNVALLKRVSTMSAASPSAISTIMGVSIEDAHKLIDIHNLTPHPRFVSKENDPGGEKAVEEQPKKTTRKKRKNWANPKKQNLGTGYNITWLNNHAKTTISPAFVPCVHEGPCGETNCECVKNAHFCTKLCCNGKRSRNFFQGCRCVGGCRSKACPCFAAKRECDPDLCTSCGACTDKEHVLFGPNSKQTCRNDNISMRRFQHLLVGVSGIEDAGWGLYTKNALQKDDFIQEYTGEMISQDEADRRGRIYDKVNRSYLFNLNSDYVIDATRKGNKTKFANHSSEKPNCYTKIVVVNGDTRIGLFAKMDMEAQTELFFDYRYEVGLEHELLTLPGVSADWMNDASMANKISKNKGIQKKF